MTDYANKGDIRDASLDRRNWPFIHEPNMASLGRLPSGSFQKIGQEQLTFAFVAAGRGDTPIVA